MMQINEPRAIIKRLQTNRKQLFVSQNNTYSILHNETQQVADFHNAYLIFFIL